MTSRKLIRRRLVDLLKNKTCAGAAVYSNVAYPLEKMELPAINIKAMSETATKWTQVDRAYKRVLTVFIQCLGRDNSYASDQVDDLASEVELILLNNPTLGLENVEDVNYRGSDLAIEVAENEVASAVLMLEITYLTQHPELPDGILAEAHIEYKHTSEANVVMSNTLTFPQE